MPVQQYAPTAFSADVVDYLIEHVAHLTSLDTLHMLHVKVAMRKEGIMLTTDDHALCNVIAAIYTDYGYLDFLSNLAVKSPPALVVNEIFKRVVYTPHLKAILDFISAEAFEHQALHSADVAVAG